MKTTLSSNIQFIIFGLLSLFSACEKNTVSSTVKDIDGNEYAIVEIGTQTWFAENLRTEHYRDGTPIPVVKSNYNWQWDGTPACCYFRNDESYKEVYGTTYNWYAATSSHGLCPEGWHTPSKEDWKILVTYLGGHEVAGGKMKLQGTDFWEAPNEGATNESGFSAIGTGCRNHNSEFISEGITTSFWSTDIYNHTSAWTLGLEKRFAEASIDFGTYMHGFHVRCLKDE